MIHADRLTVTKIVEFAAAHHLEGYDGPCANLHGHTYRLEVEVKRKDLDHPLGIGGQEDGMVVDFGQLKQAIHDLVLSKLDHQNLNDHFPCRPTAENMVLILANSMQLHLEREYGLSLVRLRLWETPTSYAEVTA